MIDIGYTIPMMIALVASAILLFYGFEERNKKTTYIYFGFFIITSLLFTLHILAHWFNIEEKLLMIMRIEYIMYLFIPPFMAYALSELFASFCYFNKRRMNLFAILAGIVSLIILFTDNFFVRYNEYLLKLKPAYAFVFFAYYSLFIATALIRFWRRENREGEKTRLPFYLINAGTITLFSVILISELLHQIEYTADITHYSHETGILACMIFLFYVSFKYGLIQMEKSIYVFGIVIISLLIIAGLLSLSNDSSAEMRKTLLDSASAREKEMIVYVDEKIGEFFHDANLTLNAVQESMSLREYLKNDSDDNRRYLMLRLNNFNIRVGFPICFIDTRKERTICSEGFDEESLNRAEIDAYLKSAKNSGDYHISYTGITAGDGFYFLKNAMRNNESIGVFISKMSMDPFRKEFEEHEISENSQNWIIYENGLVLEHCDPRMENKTLDALIDGHKWINESLNIIKDEDGKELLVERGSTQVAGIKWNIGLGTPVSDITSGAEGVLAKLRNSSIVSITLIFIISSAMIIMYIRYSKNLNGLVEKKTSEIAESKAEVEMVNASLKQANSSLNAKLRELEETKKAMMNLLEDFSESNEKLKSLDTLKTDFMNISSHELKTPLISIMGYTELLMDSKNLDEEERNNLSIIHRNSERLKALVGDILMISKLESGSIPYHEQRFDLKNLLDEAVVQIASVAKQKRIEIKIDAKNTEVNGDKDLLSYIFPNLLSNAVKFTPENGRIYVELDEKQGKIFGSVKDTGIGIPNKLINNLFQKFYQVDSSRDRKFGGTGLGLSICKQIIELHSGKIWVESVEGKGSTFRFEISKNGRAKKEE